MTELGNIEKELKKIRRELRLANLLKQAELAGSDDTKLYFLKEADSMNMNTGIN